MSGIPLGVRIEEELKIKLDNYCKSHGLKKSFFLSQLLEERLNELLEDDRDFILASKRLENLEQDGVSTLNEFNAVINKRLGKE